MQYAEPLYIKTQAHSDILRMYCILFIYCIRFIYRITFIYCIF